MLDQKPNTPAQQLWVVHMIGYDYDLVHRKGTTNATVNALSRCPHHLCRGRDQRDWVKWLPQAEWWFNTTYHIATHVTPYEIVYGQPLPTHFPYLAGDSNVAAVDKSLKAGEATIKMF